MKTQFSKNYILGNRGCYEEQQVNNLSFDENDNITLEVLFNAIPIKDFNWFLCRKCELTKTQLQLFALANATYVLPFFEKIYPKDTRVRDCIEYTEKYINGLGDKETLLKKRTDVAAAYAAATYAAATYAAATYAADAAYAAATYAAAAYAAATYAAADAADAAYAAAAAAAAAYAAADAAAAAYKEMVRVFVFETLAND